MYKSILLFFLTILSVAEGISAEPIPLSYGESLTGTIEVAGDHHIYVFTGAIGDRIMARMKGQKDGVDACIALYDPNGAMVADDCSDGRLAAISNYALTIAGEYQLHVMDHSDNDTGDYGLSIIQLNNTAAAVFQSCASNFDAELTHLAEIDAYAFEGQAGDMVLIRMKDEKDKVEPIIELYDSNGNLMDRATPNADGLARLGAIRLPEDGSYLILAYDQNGNDIGNYSFAFQLLNSAACGLPTGCGADFTASFERQAEIDAYTFTAEAGDVIVAHMRGVKTGIEPEIELYDPEGNLLAQQSSRGYLGHLNPVVLPTTGTYVLLMMDANGNDTGEYGVALQFTNAYTNCSIALDCGTIEEVRRIGSTAEIDAYSFDGAANEKLSLKVWELDEALEPRFELYAPDGSEVVNSSSGAVASKENIILPADGVYTLLVMDYEGNDEGRYMIDISSKTFIDQEAPVAVCQSVNIILDSNGEYRLTAEEIDGGSTDNCNIAGLSLDKDLFTCNDIGTQVVTLKVIDEGGNTSTCEVSVTVEDPTFACGWVYCEAAGTSTNFEWINEVSIGEIENVSGDDSGYGDYTEMITDISVSSNQIITLMPGFASQTNPVLECWGVWIDLNNDGDFDDNGEHLLQKSSKGAIYGSMAIPDYAAIGKTRMRVAMNYEAYPIACGIFNYGEVEDYTVNIVPAVNCGSLPTDWANTDIGEFEVMGESCYQSSNETFVVSSASGDIYGTDDNFEFAYTQWCGDGEIIARLTGMTNTSKYALAGIMFRKHLYTGSKNVALLATPENGLLFQGRKKHHGSTASIGVSGQAPIWLKVKREGNQYTGYTSMDGKSWTANYSTQVKMGDCIYVGLAVAANVEDATTFNTSTFDNVYVGLSTDNSDDQSGSSGQSTGYVKQNPIGELILSEGTATEAVRGESNTEPTGNEINVPLENTRTAFDVNIIKLFPNPTVDYVEVDMRKLNAEEVEIVIYNANGQLIYQQAAEAQSILHIDLKRLNLSAGSYWLNVRHKDGQMSKPLIILPKA